MSALHDKLRAAGWTIVVSPPMGRHPMLAHLGDDEELGPEIVWAERERDGVRCRVDMAALDLLIDPVGYCERQWEWMVKNR